MAKLLDKIKFEGKRFNQVTDEKEMETIIQIAEKLAPLEKEIMQYPGGDIAVTKSRTLFMAHFPDDLTKRIGQLLNR
jgi:hypothetical protein